MTQYYPVFLDLRRRLCVVVGGGKVAQHKVEFLLECQATVSVVSPTVTPEMEGWALKGLIQLSRRQYREGDLRDAFMGIAGTDDKDINAAVAQEAEARKVLINVVDTTPLCSFIAPSIVRRGDVTVAISTAGLSPALARKLRETLQSSPALDYAELASLLSEVRQELRARSINVPPDHWQECLTDEILALYKKGESEAARGKLLSCLEAGAEHK